jgi:D-beta-D-heptose 7-phosphate kinase/D-beta-D-heptose 1-phosphate adenosyltransferase
VKIKKYDRQELLPALDFFPEARVLVIGDVMMDQFIWGRVERISPEAPVPVVAVDRETFMLGGAANVLRNIVSLGGGCDLIGVVGRDHMGRQVIDEVSALGGDGQAIIVDPDRQTTMKTRVVAHSQQVVRFDRENREPIGAEVAGRILDYVDQNMDRWDAVIISDYGKGVISPLLMAGLRKSVLERELIVAVDPKIENFEFYNGVTVITPNNHEAAAGAKMTIKTDNDLKIAGRRLIEDLELPWVLITLGERGMALFSADDPATYRPIDTVAREVFDVTGAGDTVVAALTLGLAVGLPMYQSALLANYAAGLVVGEVGTAAVTVDRLRQTIESGKVRPHNTGSAGSGN